MRPPADLPLELRLLAEAFARRLEMEPGDFWAVLYRQKPAPEGWADAWADAFSLSEVLHKRLRSSTLKAPNMEKSHRLAISEGHKGDDDPFAKALRKAGFSQNALARKLGVNQALISLHRRELRKIPMSRAKAIEGLTGWPADSRHWPCGIVSDGE